MRDELVSFHFVDIFLSKCTASMHSTGRQVVSVARPFIGRGRRGHSSCLAIAFGRQHGGRRRWRVGEKRHRLPILHRQNTSAAFLLMKRIVQRQSTYRGESVNFPGSSLVSPLTTTTSVTKRFYPTKQSLDGTVVFKFTVLTLFTWINPWAVYCEGPPSFIWRGAFCPKDSGRNWATDLCNNSILQYQIGGALKIANCGFDYFLIFWHSLGQNER